MWMSVTDIVLRERNNTKSYNHVVWFHLSKLLEWENLKYSDKIRTVVPGFGVALKNDCKGHKGKFWGDGNVLYLDYNSGYKCVYFQAVCLKYVHFIVCLCAQSLSHVWLWGPMDCSPPGSSVHGIFQARILECAAISFSRGYSQPKDWTHISWSPALAGRFFTTSPTLEVL